jgi:hypothetical protein
VATFHRGRLATVEPWACHSLTFQG